MSQVERQIECSTCPWNKNCIEPPSMTKEDVEKTVEEMEEKGGSKEGKLMSGLMSALVFVGKDKECHACPVFIEKLRQSPELSMKIKEIMKQQ